MVTVCNRQPMRHYVILTQPVYNSNIFIDNKRKKYRNVVEFFSKFCCLLCIYLIELNSSNTFFNMAYLRLNYLIFFKRYKSNTHFQNVLKQVKSSFPKPVFDWMYICTILSEFKEMLSIKNRVISNDLSQKILKILNEKNLSNIKINEELISYISKLPNIVHPKIKKYDNNFEIIKIVGEIKKHPFKAMNGTELLSEKDLLKITGLNYFCGERSYYFTGDLTKFEQALIDFTVQKLLKKKFILLSVPDILYDNIIESCGMPTKGTRSQIFKLNSDIYGSGWCLSGTSEMAIAAFFMNSNLNAKMLPLYIAAVSRCYRAEISNLAAEKGIYRVHQFTKVEMFGVCLPSQSDELLELFREIQEELFSSYDINYRVIDMAPCELEKKAYRKYDIEAWMPGLNQYGEISSCTNCRDYQSRRLNIRCGTEFVHTVNGTACAIPRIVNAIAETHQTKQGRVEIPIALRSLVGFDVLGMKRGPNMRRIQKIPKNLKRNCYIF